MNPFVLFTPTYAKENEPRGKRRRRIGSGRVVRSATKMEESEQNCRSWFRESFPGNDPRRVKTSGLSFFLDEVLFDQLPYKDEAGSRELERNGQDDSEALA
jgi:hypothetical protein